MNEVDLEQIEAGISCKLPHAYRRFISDFESARTCRLAVPNSGDATLATDAEQFVIEHLQMLNDVRFDLYGLQPELKSLQHVYLCSDGSGNHYFMEGCAEPSEFVWLWHHDPPDGFVKAQTVRLDSQMEFQPVDLTLEDFFQSDWQTQFVTDPIHEIEADDNLYICRSDHPWRSILQPISLEEWERAVDVSDCLERADVNVMKNQFTGDSYEVVERGRVRLITDSPKSLFARCEHGRIVVPRSAADSLGEGIGAVAAALNAEVFS